MSIHEQARAEAERTACEHCPDGHARPESRPWGVFVASEVDGDGQPTHLYVAPTAGQHVAESDAEWARARLNEAATRTRVVTTVTELDALPDRTCIIDADMELHQRHGTLLDLDRTVESAWLGLLPPTLSASSEVRLPARVLYEPEE